jgi:N-acetylglucosaminyldiphosphoundecaprenol N-acetyl-beta-D-mannosaminyltransferase
LHEADLCLADGIGLVVASRWVAQQMGQLVLPERVPGSELVYHLAELCAQKGWRLFLLGAAPGVADEAAAIFQQKYPGLTIAGTYAGSPAPDENEGIVQRINDSKAEILFVAYGAPKQDKWIARNRESLPTVRVAIGVGGSLDFVTGKSIRAPRWVQNLGLEWLHRLIKEPWRWRRMLALPRFVLAVVTQHTG